LAPDHQVIIPDLRGLDLSSKPPGGFDKKTQAGDVAGVLAVLGVDQIDLVAHDIGNMVAFHLAEQHPDRVTRLVLIDAPIPEIDPCEEILMNPLLCHFRFGGPEMERPVAGRERIYLDRFWHEFSADLAKFYEAARVHYAQLYASWRHAFWLRTVRGLDQDAADNRAWLVTGTRLRMLLLAVGGEKSFGTTMAAVMQAAATDMQEGIILGSGHWIWKTTHRRRSPSSAASQPPSLASPESWMAATVGSSDLNMIAMMNQSISPGKPRPYRPGAATTTHGSTIAPPGA
jgi:pimeloyl-ACP methyl ester carboxylesterase